MTKIILDDFGIFLGRKRNRFIIRKGEEKREFQAETVDSIICTTIGASITSSALRLAAEKKIQMIFAYHSGDPYAILMPTTLTGSVRARREQFEAYTDKRSLTLAKAFIKGKLKNQANILKLMAKNRKPRNRRLAAELYKAGRTIDGINQTIDQIEGRNIDEKRQTLMNIEAEAARTYWRAISLTLPTELEFTGRKTRGAKDPFNAMLNFGYQAALFPEVWRAICYAGLDPYAGFLHADRPGKPSLVLDLMEEFRQQTIDRTLINLISKKIIKPDEILATETEAEERTLTKKTVQKIFEEFMNRLETKVMFNNRKGTIKSFIHQQARNITRYLLKDTKTYTPFTLGW